MLCGCSSKSRRITAIGVASGSPSANVKPIPRITEPWKALPRFSARRTGSSSPPAWNRKEEMWLTGMPSRTAMGIGPPRDTWTTETVTAALPGHLKRRRASNTRPPFLQIQARPDLRVSPCAIELVASSPKQPPWRKLEKARRKKKATRSLFPAVPGVTNLR